MKVGFSTLGCPAWSLRHAIDQAKVLGYDGLELRLIDGQVVSVDLAAEKRDRIRDVLASAGVEVSALGTSVKLVAPDADATEAELRSGLELAAHWSIPVVRVFGGRAAEGESMAAATRRGAGVVSAVAPEAKRLGIRVALETHDDFSAAAPVAALAEAVGDPTFGVIWDIQHTWRAGDTPKAAWDLLGPHVLELHVKDGRETPDGWQQTNLGDGELPVRESISLARENGFDSWIVVEWEKHWHPDLADPEEAFPAHRSALADLLGSR